MKNAKPVSSVSPNALKSYFLASRPKTWIASISPVLIGGALAPSLNGAVFIFTLLFSLFIQIGTNYANDYFDFLKGADTSARMGPKRATLEGWISPAAMLRASLLFFASALWIAIPLIKIAGLWSLFLAFSCALFGFLYTGGPKPLGYLGLGELFVFPFFGPVACCGTYFLQTGTLTLPVFFASLAPGFLSCAILIANNLRDEESDRKAKKRTLIVRFGKTFGAIEYTTAVMFAAMVPFLLVFAFGANPLLLTASAVFVLTPIRKVFSSEVVPVLPKTALLLTLYTALFCYIAIN